MNLIIPMAGRGTRLRPHTLTTPKPLLQIAGKSIVQRLAEDIAEIYNGKIDHIAFVIGDFGKEVEQQLLDIAAHLGAKGSLHYQDTPLGTAHAIWQAREAMDGEVIIAFADTLFRADFQMDRSKDGVIWVKTVDNPQSFGVVTLDGDGNINGMVEKPQEPVSDLAIIGIYYLKDGPVLRGEIQHLLDNDIREKGEYQLTNALENMRLKGAKFGAGKVNDWMDCGNKDAVLDTNRKILDYDHAAGKSLRAANVTLRNAVVIEPCFLGSGVVIENSVVGPHVALMDNTQVSHSVISMTMAGEGSLIRNTVLHNSMLGTKSVSERKPLHLDIGDYSRIRE
jgi:glucose-1-phosphate thymidylyltransferase